MSNEKPRISHMALNTELGDLNRAIEESISQMLLNQEGAVERALRFARKREKLLMSKDNHSDNAAA